MIRINSLKLNIEYTDDDIQKAILKHLNISKNDLISFTPIKRSLDARKKEDIHYVFSIDANIKNEDKILKNKRIKNISASGEVIYPDPIDSENIKNAVKNIENIKRPVIIGLGPAGLFCAYMLAKAGLKPIVFERGKNVDERTADVNHFWTSSELNPESNVQFGEGGAGTFSDGKLNTMIHDNYGRIKKVFDILVSFGADESIKYIAKPHIGTDKLKEIIKNIRNEIISCGGEVHFGSKLTDIRFENHYVKSILINNTREVECNTLVLAIGHSARDTFKLIHELNIPMERKAFAIGVRVQHPQSLIGYSQYGEIYKKLPAADYKLTYNTSGGRGVYSFCMCPGGFVVNASSEPGRLAVNGMSNSDRSEITANSALVVSVNENDFKGNSVLAGMEFQRELEEKCFKEGNGRIPVQYYKDFVENKVSEDLDENLPNTKGSYATGNLRNILPDFITDGIIEAMPSFGKTIKDYDNDYALFLGLESRTSSPVRILRNEEFESVDLKGLYPCGEGAGYAGGITSAAVDGIKVYEAIINKILKEI